MGHLLSIHKYIGGGQDNLVGSQKSFEVPKKGVKKFQTPKKGGEKV